MPNANWFNLNRSNTPLGCFADTRPVQPLLNYVNTKILAGSRSTAFLGRGDRANWEPAGSEPIIWDEERGEAGSGQRNCSVD